MKKTLISGEFHLLGEFLILMASLILVCVCVVYNSVETFKARLPGLLSVGEEATTVTALFSCQGGCRGGRWSRGTGRKRGESSY